MLTLVGGLVIFFGIHLLPAAQSLRSGLIERFGELAFKAVFAVVSLVGLILIIQGYGALQETPGKNPILWSPPTWTSHIALALMPFAFILLVAAYVPSKIRDVTRHPMLAAIKLWALVHLLANGDLASILLFGSFLAYGVFDRISLKRRTVPSGPPIGPAKGIVGDIAAVAIGLAAYFGMLYWGHAAWIGIAVLPG